eukprot:scaffold319043_cov46-Tisochrysis_lutea.AAC.1
MERTCGFGCDRDTASPGSSTNLRNGALPFGLSGDDVSPMDIGSALHCANATSACFSGGVVSKSERSVSESTCSIVDACDMKLDVEERVVDELNGPRSTLMGKATLDKAANVESPSKASSSECPSGALDGPQGIFVVLPQSRLWTDRSVWM